jgi:hypothetical protein
MTVYHGSLVEIRAPRYKGSVADCDYGSGFYITDDIELGKEWSVLRSDYDGVLNVYRLDMEGLRSLDLKERPMALSVAILLKNRAFPNKENYMKLIDRFLQKYYDPCVEEYDVVHGYRADDSVFNYLYNFITNFVSIEKLGEVIEKGGWGTQMFLQSEKAMRQIAFIRSEAVPHVEYRPKILKREMGSIEAVSGMGDLWEGRTILNLL